jgi:hypothetical protein
MVSRSKWTWVANLPTGFLRKARYLQAEDCTAWSRHRWAVRWAMEIFFVTWSTGKLYGKTFTFEVGTIYNPDIG